MRFANVYNKRTEQHNTNQNDKNPSKSSEKQTLQRGSRGLVRVEQTNETEKKNRHTHTAMDDR